MLIQVATLARKLQRGLRLTELPDSVLAPETVPVIIVEDYSAPLVDESRGCFGSMAITAVAAELSMSQLSKAVAPSQYDLTVHGVYVGTQTTQRIRIFKPTVALSGLTEVTDKSFRDFNVPGQPASSLTFSTELVRPANVSLYQFDLLANTTIYVPLNVRIGSPGVGDENVAIVVAGDSVNENLTASWAWTESTPEG